MFGVGRITRAEIQAETYEFFSVADGAEEDKDRGGGGEFMTRNGYGLRWEVEDGRYV